jgi:hypothetical protein
MRPAELCVLLAADRLNTTSVSVCCGRFLYTHVPAHTFITRLTNAFILRNKQRTLTLVLV